MFLSTVKPNLHLNYCSPLYPYSSPSCNTVSLLSFPLSPCFKHGYPSKDTRLNARSNESDLKPQDSSSLHPDSKSKAKKQHQKSKDQKIKDNDSATIFPTTIPKKPRRGRKSEAAAVEDFVRDSLEQTFASIRQQNPDILKDGVNIVKEKIGNEVNSDGSDDDEDDNEEEIKAKKMVVEEDNPDWPLDAEVGWGIRASDYFQKHPIKNVVGEDGTEIDWEGEIEDSWVKEINCLEWETFAFHPSPLIVFVFERYNHATANWRVLKELEKATKVYWSAKDRLPPRAVKVDINIEKDLAFALKIRECPQILFLRGNRILYREKQFRTSDELVQMIAHFYYKAKKPSCMNGATLY